MIEVSVPRDARVGIVRNEKREKYVPLVNHLKRIYKGWVCFVPMVIGATGVVSNEVVVATGRLGIGLELSWLQKIAATATANFITQIV